MASIIGAAEDGGVSSGTGDAGLQGDAILRAMDLTFLGWIIVGLIAGIISGVIAGGRTARGWMPSLFIGLIAAVITGWLLTSFAGVDSITSIWLSALLATIVAIVLRLLMKTVSFGD